MGFTASIADSSLFIKKSGASVAYVLIYVDDIIVTGSDSTMVDNLISDLGSEFAVKDMGNLSYFLGIEVLHQGQSLVLSQRKYVSDLLRCTKLDGIKPVSTPLAANVKIQKLGSEKFTDPTLYRSVVGALQYLHITRPDISVAVNKACQYMHEPYIEHWELVKIILRYLKHSIDYGLFFTPGGDYTLNAYSDADWAGSLDDRRSTSGYCIYFGGNLVSWNARKQKTVSKSSTEAEYRGVAIATSEIIWIQSLLVELGVATPTPSHWCDNIGATYLTANPIFHARTKHIEIDYHFVRERVARKQLHVKFVSSRDQLADIFTKGLPSPRFQFIRHKLHIRQLQYNLRDGVKHTAESLPQDSQLSQSITKSNNTSQ
ncbi:uncharacterized protein LOC113312572 [Papaver somniferum]|uniref:uncharacterized protein LOC113312572 n=1 Tax=Papaver somniferum TaxID=3469 RepID=UPI000E701541|nr:uncharacterized protein LOC113312572 [Papaver somniferum]